MNLLDLLVRELPGKGGWPGSAYDGEQMGLKNVQWHYGGEGCPPRASLANQKGPLVRKSEYVVALAASKQIVWDGDGLPPDVCECETQHRSVEGWHPIKIVAVENGAVFGFWKESGAPCALLNEVYSFRPIRTEAERRREDAETALQTSLAGTGSSITPLAAERIYNAIAAGKIPGVKLEDS